MSEEKKHVIISLILWAAVIVLVAIGGVAVYRGGLRGVSGAAGGLPPEESVGVTSSETQESEPESLPEESSQETLSREDDRTASTISSEAAVSSEAVASREEPVSSENGHMQYVDESGATAVTLFGGGRETVLTPEQITEFMLVYGKVSLVQAEAGAGTVQAETGEAGFTVAYQDGRRESFRIGQVYDGIWTAGGQVYQTGAAAYDLESYICQYPVISDWLNSRETAAPSSEASQE